MKINYPDELIFLKNKKAIQKQYSQDIQNKVVVITGATSGVGYQALKQCALHQATLVMVARNVEKANQIKAEMVTQYSANIDIVIADFSLLEDVRKAAQIINNKYPRIDVLINCAGLHSTKATYTPEGFETVFCVNHLASFLFTQLLLKRLVESSPARILHINSEGHRFNGLDLADIHWKKRIYTGLRGYGASKTAQLLTMWEIDDLLKGTGVTINAMHPGDVKTNIGQNNGWFYRAFSKLFISRMLKDPHISGEAIYYLIADPSLTQVSGKFFHLTILETPAKHACDRNVGKKVYELSKKLTGLSE